MLRVLCIFLAMMLCLAIGDRPRVRTSSGILIGETNERFSLPLKVFLGVPYAKPPVGDLRFRAPLPINDEESIVETRRFAPSCVQPPHIKTAINPLLRLNVTSMSEDCLYLNLYVPQESHDQSLPVMVWLTGEGFSYADPTQFDGSLLAAKSKAIVVTVNYRVSVFGFLSALSSDAPGNAGLWDQRMALKWVQKNIAAFGGNPEKVTLFGRFTGAMSAAIHAFSRLSKEETLFDRVILHSGVPDGKWIFDTTPLNSVTELAEIVECVFGNLSATITCLKNLPAHKLLEASLSVQNAWRPSLDFSLIDEIAIDKIVQREFSPVDVMIMTNKDEGSLCLTALKVLSPAMYDSMVNDRLSRAEFEHLLSSFVRDVYKESNRFVEKLTAFMYSQNNASDYKRQFMQFCGDLYIHALTGKLANQLAEKKTNLYVAELTHRPVFSNQPSFVEAGHGDDVLYSFGLPLQLESLPEEEKQLTESMIEHIRNFVYFGNPNTINETHWPVYSEDTKLVMNFDLLPNTNDIKKTSHENAVMFWGTVIPAAFKNTCPPAPISAFLTEADNTDFNTSTHVTFLGTWISVYAAEYIMTILFCLTCLLLISILIALLTIYRQTSSMTFHRLK